MVRPGGVGYGPPRGFVSSGGFRCRSNPTLVGPGQVSVGSGSVGHGREKASGATRSLLLFPPGVSQHPSGEVWLGWVGLPPVWYGVAWRGTVGKRPQNPGAFYFSRCTLPQLVRRGKAGLGLVRRWSGKVWKGKGKGLGILGPFALFLPYVALLHELSDELLPRLRPYVEGRPIEPVGPKDDPPSGTIPAGAPP